MNAGAWTGLALLASLAVGAGAAGLGRVLHRRRAPLPDENLIGAAMRRLGITPVDAEAAGLEAGLAQARHLCASCTLRAECRERLSDPRAGIPQRCPNASLFARIRRERARRQPPAGRRWGAGAWKSPPRM